MRRSAVMFLLALALARAAEPPPDFVPVLCNDPGLVVDLGVGLWAWPLPTDLDGDGDLDLVVSCPDTPFKGAYWFENPGGGTFPVLRPPRRFDNGWTNVRISQLDGRWVVSTPRRLYPDVSPEGYGQAVPIAVEGDIWAPNLRLRANQWQFADLNGDGLDDLVVGVGSWHEYGWDNAFDAQGNWTKGPLHGYVYWAPNTGQKGSPKFAGAGKLNAGGGPLDVYGMPSPCLADFDGDGDQDLICGDFRDSLTYFANVGSREMPHFTPGRELPFRMHLCMIVPTVVDWDKDGHPDLVIGQEDGRVAWLRHTGETVDGMPQFQPPRFFRQQADRLKFGALATPHAVDWDGDGDEDLICGNTAGEVAFIENLDGGNPPRWAPPGLLRTGGQPFRILAGPNGSVQGPAESKWGYTTVTAADWDGDGFLDVLVNSIWGRVVWLRNPGTPGTLDLEAPRPVQVAWPDKPPKPAWNWWNPEPDELATQWRTTPYAIDWNRDGLMDLVMLDHEGYLAVFRRVRRDGQLVLLPGERSILGPDRKPLRLNNRPAGGSGRRKICFADWDGDGRLDLLVNSRNVDLYRNVGTGGEMVFRNHGQVAARKLAGHTSSPTIVDWNHNGRPELLVGAEDGHFYYLPEFTPPHDPPAGPPATHLVAAWDFDGPEPLADKASAGQHRDDLVAVGAAKVADGIARIPKKTASLLEAKSSPDLEFGGEFTIWLRVRASQPPASYQSLVDKRRFAKPTARSYGLFIPPVAAGERFGVGGQISADGTSPSVSHMQSAPVLPTNEWCDVALVLRRKGAYLVAEWSGGTKGHAKLLPNPDAAGLLSVFRAKQPLLIGNDANRKPGQADLEFDEIRLYNRALTSEELREIAR